MLVNYSSSWISLDVEDDGLRSVELSIHLWTLRWLMSLILALKVLWHFGHVVPVGRSGFGCCCLSVRFFFFILLLLHICWLRMPLFFLWWCYSRAFCFGRWFPSYLSQFYISSCWLLKRLCTFSSGHFLTFAFFKLGIEDHLWRAFVFHSNNVIVSS